MDKKKFFILLAIQFTEVLGFSLILPFLPFFAQELGASAFQVGLILTVFSFFQFFSAPIMGKLSDSYGRRPLLLISQFSTFISFIVLALANQLWIIFASRIIDGLLGSNFTIAQAYLTDITPKKERTKIFSFMGISFGFGFFIGPAIGGYLAQFGYAYPSILAAIITAITIFLTYRFLPETVTRSTDFKFSWDLFEITKFKQYFHQPKLAITLWEYFTYVLAHSLWASGFALYAQRQLSFTSQDIGISLASIGGISIFMRGWFLPKLIDRVDEMKLRHWAAGLIIVAMLLTPFITSWPFLMITIVLFAFGSGILRPSLTSHISRNTNDEEQGAVMGVASSLSSIAQVIGPLMAGWLIQHFIPGSLGLVAAGIMLVGLILLLKESKFIKSYSQLEG